MSHLKNRNGNIQKLSGKSSRNIADVSGGAMVENPPVNAGGIKDSGSMLGSGSSPGGGHGNPLQYSCLENPMDRGA